MKKTLLALTGALLLWQQPAFASPEAADELNELLRGEVSAVETYKQALETVSAPELSTALSNHQAAVKVLQEKVVSVGGTPAKSSGVWGMWAQAVTGTAKTISRDAALKALKEGEEHGVKEYKEVLEDKDVPQSIKDVIAKDLLPKQQAHVISIDGLMARN